MLATIPGRPEAVHARVRGSPSAKRCWAGVTQALRNSQDEKKFHDEATRGSSVSTGDQDRIEPLLRPQTAEFRYGGAPIRDIGRPTNWPTRTTSRRASRCWGCPAGAPVVRESAPERKNGAAGFRTLELPLEDGHLDPNYRRPLIDCGCGRTMASSTQWARKRRFGNWRRERDRFSVFVKLRIFNIIQLLNCSDCSFAHSPPQTLQEHTTRDVQALSPGFLTIALRRSKSLDSAVDFQDAGTHSATRPNSLSRRP